MYSTLEKVMIVEFHKTIHLIVATQRKSCQWYNVRRSPSSKTSKSIVFKFKTKGSFLNQQSERPKEGRSVENMETVRLSLIEDPKKSYRHYT